MSDEVRLAFTMQARVVRGGPPPEPIPDPLPPGWARFPVRIEARMSAAMADHLLHGGPAPGPGGDATLVASTLRLDLDHAQLGDLTPQEVHAVLDAFNPPQDRAEGLDHGTDRPPVGPAPAASMSVPALKTLKSRPGSGLSALYLVQRAVTFRCPLDELVTRAVPGKAPQHVEPDEQHNLQEFSSTAWTNLLKGHQNGLGIRRRWRRKAIRRRWTVAKALAALQRGIQVADQAPDVHRDTHLARAAPEDEDEELFGELFDPLASVRVAEFNRAIARLRGIDPNNPNLTYLAPPHWIPSQDAIDRVNRDISAALATKQDGTAARPTWRQSERDVGVDLGPSHDSQVSYKNHNVVEYGTAGSVRPDFISPDVKSASFEVKNYNINANTASLVKVVSEQAKTRQANLPEGACSRASSSTYADRA